MPFIRKTARRPARHVVTLSQLTLTNWQVIDETFHLYHRHKGRLPVRLANKPAIVRKWEFVECMARRISMAR